MPIVEKRYAESLVYVLAKEEDFDLSQSQLSNVVKIFNEQINLKRFLLNPQFQKDIKKKVIVSIFETQINVKILNFILLLIDKDRIKILPGIHNEFLKLADKMKNVINIKIFTAANLDDEYISKIKEKYIKIYNASNAEIHVYVDESLLGGIKIQIGDNVIDASLKGKMQELKEILLKS